MVLKKIAGFVRLLRPELPLAAGICTITGQILSAGRFPEMRLVLFAFFCVFCLSASALVFNDYFDYEVDLINAPQRPLPAGVIHPTEAVIFGSVVTILGLFIAYLISVEALFVAIVIWLIGFSYNWRYKETGLLGNLMVSFSVAVTFLFGAITLNDPWNAIVWTFSLMAFFFDLGEEIAGDAMDMTGDRLRDSRSIALLKGRQFALRLSVGMWVVVILLGFIPVIMQWLGVTYRIFIAIMTIMLIFFSIQLLQSQDPQSGRRAMRGAYLAATVFVLAFLVARIL